MKADVQYNDFIGTAAADISDSISTSFGGDNLDSYADFFKIDKEKFKLIGISFYGRKIPSISLICVDLDKSTEEKEHIVNMSIDWESEKHPFEVLFKRFHVVLFEKYDEKYPLLDYDEEVKYIDYHQHKDQE